MLSRRVDIWIALVFLVLSLLALFAWVPFDSETPAIYTFRRQTYIGDAMLPMLAAAGIVVFSALHLLLSIMRRETVDRDPPFDVLTATFFALFGLIVVAALVAMYWAGPVAVSFFGPSGDESISYRHLRSSVPWKYLGFFIGGFILIFGVATLITGRMSWRRAVIAVAALVVLVLVFDVPFDTILLPPNGDF